ncbi:hypothetical protein ACWTU6_31075 [Mesorhizobium sp. BHbsci]
MPQMHKLCRNLLPGIDSSLVAMVTPSERSKSAALVGRDSCTLTLTETYDRLSLVIVEHAGFKVCRLPGFDLFRSRNRGPNQASPTEVVGIVELMVDATTSLVISAIVYRRRRNQ